MPVAYKRRITQKERKDDGFERFITPSVPFAERRIIKMKYATLSNGVKMPMLGYGVYQVTKEECERCVLDALKVGYRSIDTAQSYFNEEEVGSAIRKSRIPRNESSLTTKVWVENYGYEECKKSVESA